MTSRKLTSIAIRIIALYLFYTAVICFPMWLTFAHKYIAKRGLAYVAIAAGVIGGTFIAGVAWKFAWSLGRDLRASPEETINVQFGKADLEQVLLRMFGLYVFATNLRPVADNFLRLSFADPTGGMLDLRPTRVALIVNLIMIGFAVSFFLKPAFWQRKFESWNKPKTGESPTTESNATSG